MINFKYDGKNLLPLDASEKAKVDKFKKKLTLDERVGMDLYSKGQLSSKRQLAKYYSEILPTAMYFLDDVTQYGNNKEAAHLHLKLMFCMEARHDLCQVVVVNEQRNVIPFSLALNDCSQRDRNQFFKWLGDKIAVHTGKDLDGSIVMFKSV